MAYRLSHRARRDVIEIWAYIASDNEPAADRFIDLLTHHYLGRRREELRRGYRGFPVGQYVIFYRVAEPGVRIVRILHGRRDVPEQLG
jgi:toxin ParE1/3/4